MKRVRSSSAAMSLVEVAMAIGILSFCGVALMGLLPTMLNTSREARETTVVARIYQTVADDLDKNPSTIGTPRFFTMQGALQANAQNSHYKVTSGPSTSANLAGSTNVNILMVPLVIENTVRGSTNLLRPVFLSHGTK